MIALAEALVRSRAQEAGLAYELIAARADLAPIVVAARRGAGRARRAHAARLAARASSAPSCSSCSAAGGRLSVGQGGRIAVDGD